jgi:hypothetical protein
MSEVAFKIAQKHFGATKEVPTTKEVPIELLKLEIIKGIKPEEPKMKAPETKLEPVKVETKVEVKEPKVIKRRRRNEGTKK